VADQQNAHRVRAHGAPPLVSVVTPRV
jgi:hypothetical protein